MLCHFQLSLMLMLQLLIILDFHLLMIQDLINCGNALFLILKEEGKLIKEEEWNLLLVVIVFLDRGSLRVIIFNHLMQQA